MSEQIHLNINEIPQRNSSIFLSILITEKRQFGNKGEDVATDYLRKNGFKIRERNFLVPQGEIDIIAEKNGEIVFVEVKTRTSNAFGNPFDAITTKKCKRLITASYMYLKKEKLTERAFRIDAISVTFPGPVIDHLEGAVGEG